MATLTTSSSKPEETTIVTDTVGLLNYYEYVTSYRGASSSTVYLNNGLEWWTLYTNVAEVKVGLLRYGELMSGQFDRYGNNTTYWTLTPYSSYYVWYVSYMGNLSYISPSSYSYSVRPALNLKSNIIITSGDGTKNNPFEIKLG